MTRGYIFISKLTINVKLRVYFRISFANGIGIFRRVFGSELEDEGEIGVGTE